MRLSACDPELPRQLARQRLAHQVDTSATRLFGGETQGGGARFAKDIVGTEQQATNLDAALGALGVSNTRQGMANTLDVFRATGTWNPQGSPTDFNRQIREAFGEMPLTARAWLGRNKAALADVLTAPHWRNRDAGTRDA
ncbi:hypothetical protein HCU64_23755 [Methylobacterium sp. C25]|uniref:hypothetical protein n=1 Tax=Methylobacterium sp. C25 TaxID=2721622 RepID=UPI001F3C9DBC|nr:hypothetical protein [Methylobacterium sp. C25]MCE4226761.1 hypothetical protein [Methylobacterium sp. C25]